MRLTITLLSFFALLAACHGGTNTNWTARARSLSVDTNGVLVAPTPAEFRGSNDIASASDLQSLNDAYTAFTNLAANFARMTGFSVTGNIYLAATNSGFANNKSYQISFVSTDSGLALVTDVLYAIDGDLYFNTDRLPKISRDGVTNINHEANWGSFTLANSPGWMPAAISFWVWGPFAEIGLFDLTIGVDGQLLVRENNSGRSTYVAMAPQIVTNANTGLYIPRFQGDLMRDVSSNITYIAEDGTTNGWSPL